MPRTTRRPGRRPRRRTFRKGPRRAHKINSLMAASVRPDRLLVKLPYSDNYATNLAAGTGQTRVWNLNSIYDPDRTGIGHQPLGYDQWATFYNRYRVFKVAYNISITNLTSDSAVMGGIVPTNAAFGAFNDMSVFEQPHMKKFHIGSVASNSTKTLKGVIHLPRITGRPLVSYKSDNVYQAQFTASPNEIMCLNLLTYPLNSNAGIVMSVRLVYFVELYDPKPMPLSSTHQTGPDDIIPVGNDDEQNTITNISGV